MAFDTLGYQGIGFGTLVSVVYRDITKLLMSHDIADATCHGPSHFSVQRGTLIVVSVSLS
jgi:hypothetical protein